MTLVPIMAAVLFKQEIVRARDTHELKHMKLSFQSFQNRFHRLTERYTASMDTIPRLVALLFLGALWGFSKLGAELFPQMDVGQISIDVRLESGRSPGAKPRA